jgi:hypothetical protein
MNDFANELKALLEKYNASIVWTCGDCSDLHGVYDQRMQVQTKDKILLDIHGDCISAYEIELDQE